MIIFDQLKRGDPQLRLLTGAVLCGLSVLACGLWFVQVVLASRYRAQEQTQSLRFVRVPAARGKIFDQRGVTLAENRPSYTVNLYLEELRPLFRKEFDRIRPMTNAPAAPFWKRWLGMSSPKLAPVKLLPVERDLLNEQARYAVVSNVLAEVSRDLQQPVAITLDKLNKHYNTLRAMPLTVASDLKPAQIARIEEQGHPPLGVGVEVQPLRYYPRKTTAAHVLGHLQGFDGPDTSKPSASRYGSRDFRGVVGVEGAFDEALRGVAGEKVVLVNNFQYRQSENVVLPPEPGMNVVLTLDAELQQVAERALHQPGSETIGSVVVMDPNSGDIYAMVSAPAFDPNDYIPRLSPGTSDYLNNESLAPQKNRAVQENYSPGSIFKVVTSLALLESGLNTNEIWTVEADPARAGRGMIQVGRQKIEDTAPPGEYKFQRAFMKSSNSYFIHHALLMVNGLDEIIRMAQALHLGERTGLPTKQEVPGTLPTREWRQNHGMRNWSEGQTANLCIGQGEVDVTPLQMAVAYAAIANGGKVYRPRLVEKLVPQDPFSGQPAQEFPRAELRNTLPVSQRTLAIIRDAMRADVEEAEGSGRLAFVSSAFRVSGKTGTAENDPRRHRGKTTWFASFAPYEAPRYVVLVMIEGGVSGGATCAPVAAKIYSYLQQREAASSRRAAATTAAGGNPGF